MIRTDFGYRVATFPIFSDQNNRILATKIEVRDLRNRKTATLYSGPGLFMAWGAAERHIEAVEDARPEAEAAA